MAPSTSCALQAPGLWESWELFWVLLQDKLPVQKCLQVFPSSHPLCARAVIARQLTGRIYCLLVLTMQTLPGLLPFTLFPCLFSNAVLSGLSFLLILSMGLASSGGNPGEVGMPSYPCHSHISRSHPPGAPCAATGDL